MGYKEELSGKFSGIALYTDLSQATIQHRKKLITITKALRNHNTYRWGTPSKLVVSSLDKTVNIFSLESGLRFLKEWNILPAEAPPEERRAPTKLKRMVIK